MHYFHTTVCAENVTNSPYPTGETAYADFSCGSSNAYVLGKVVFMTVGEKIKYIRTFRGMTQQQLGVAIGLSAKGADNRMAQY